MSAEYPVVAFLQSPWLPADATSSMIRQYITDQKYRRIVLSRTALGKRLVHAFDYRFSQIWWDTSSPGNGEVDPEHMLEVFYGIQPKGIITFGATAHQGMQAIATEIRWDGRWHSFPHPTSHNVTQYQLNAFAAEVISRYF